MINLHFLPILEEQESRSDHNNANLYFEMTFSLPSPSSCLKPHLHEQFSLDKFALTRKNSLCRWGIVDKFSLSRKIWRASFSLTRKNCQVRNLLV